MIRKKGAVQRPDSAKVGKSGNSTRPRRPLGRGPRGPGPGVIPGEGPRPGPKTHFSRSRKSGSGKIGKFEAPPSAPWERTWEPGLESSPAKDRAPTKNPLFPTAEIERVEKSGNSAAPTAPWERGHERRIGIPGRGESTVEKTHFSRFRKPRVGKVGNSVLHPQSLREDSGTGNHFTRGDRHSRWRDPRRPKNPLFPTPEIEAVGKSGNSTAPPRPSRGLWTRSRFPARGQRPAEKPTFP